MAVQGIHAYSRKYFELPDLLATSYYDAETRQGPREVPLMFLTRVSNGQRDEIVKEVESGDVPEGASARPLETIPWLRNTTPSLLDVFDLIDDSIGTHIFIDQRGIDEKTCIISHWYCPEGLPAGSIGEQEVARIEWKNAISVVSRASKTESWFSELLPEATRIRKEDAAVDSDEVQSQKSKLLTQNEEQLWEWPAHIPKDLKLSEDKPTIVSMFHLTETEMVSLILEIGSNEALGPVAIINWPADIEPASTRDIWNIFDRIKPDWPTPIGEVFFITVDSFHLSGTKREPQIVVYSRKRIDGRERGLSIDGLRIENKMGSFVAKPTGFYAIWECAFNPSGRGWSSDVRHNDKMRSVIEQEGSLYSAFGTLANPALPVLWEYLPIFILTEVTATQERDLRLWLNCFNENCVLRVPRAYSDGTLKGLMKWFQSPDFMCYEEKPPRDFIAIDSISLAALPSFLCNPEGAEKPGFLAATGAYIWHEGEHGAQLACDEVGYVVGRASLTEPEGLTYWVGFVCQSMGCMMMIEEAATEDQTGAGKYYWECFDVEDDELAELVRTME